MSNGETKMLRKSKVTNTLVTSTLDVEVILSEALGGVKYVERFLDIFKERNKPNAIVHPKAWLNSSVWRAINKAVKHMGGRWSRKENHWIVPLVEKP